jgi:hypothetical protein
MWESPIYKFEDETTEKGKIVKRPFFINVTYSVPRKFDDPGKALIGVFKKITSNLKPAETNILDVGAGKLRNTLWLLQKGFHVWAIEFPELEKRLPEAKKKWDLARRYSNFHDVTCPKDFMKLDKKFDVILFINEINVMPIPLERYILLAICREKIKKDGILLWHQWRGLADHPKDYTKENEFIDGYLKGNGPNHTFYVEHTKEEAIELLYSLGFSFNKEMNLHKVKSNSCHSYAFNPTHDLLLSNTLDIINNIKKPNPDVIDPIECPVLKMYLDELKTIPKDKDNKENAHKYHLLASRIFFDIFKNQLKEPITEAEINEGRGRIDVTYSNRNREGIFKDLKDLRNISCPEIIVECKNYKKSLQNTEFAQLNERLVPGRGNLGILICRDKQDENKVIAQCRDRHKDPNKFIFVLDDKDLIKLGELKLNEENEDAINDFINNKIKEIID